MDSHKAMEANSSHAHNGNGGTVVAVSSPLTSEKLMTQSNGTRKTFEEYFIPVNTHKKLLRGEKLYLTKDDRKLCQGWKRVIICGFITIIIAVAILVGALAATGILLADSENKTARHESTGHHLPNTASISQPGISLRPHQSSNVPQKFLPLTTMNSFLETTPPSRGTTYNVVSEATSQVNPKVPVLPGDSSQSHTIVPNSLVGEFKITDENFTEDLNDNSSYGYLSMATHLENELKKLFRRNGGVFEALKILNFRPGSIVVTYVVIWEGEQGVIRAKQATEIMNSYLKNHDDRFLAFHVEESSVKFTDVVDECRAQNGGCSQDCVWSYSTLSKHCSCDVGMKLSEDGKTCVEDFTSGSEQPQALDTLPAITAVPEILPVTTATPEELPVTTLTPEELPVTTVTPEVLPVTTVTPEVLPDITTTMTTASTTTSTTATPLEVQMPSEAHSVETTTRITQEPPTTLTTREPPITYTTQEPPTTYTTQAPPTTNITQEPPTTHTTQEPPTEASFSTEEVLTLKDEEDSTRPFDSPVLSTTSDSGSNPPSTEEHTISILDQTSPSSHSDVSENNSPLVTFVPPYSPITEEDMTTSPSVPPVFTEESSTVSYLEEAESDHRSTVSATESSTSPSLLSDQQPASPSTIEDSTTQFTTDVQTATLTENFAGFEDGLKHSTSTIEYSDELELNPPGLTTVNEVPATTVSHDSTTFSITTSETEELQYRHPVLPVTTESNSMDLSSGIETSTASPSTADYSSLAKESHTQESMSSLHSVTVASIFTEESETSSPIENTAYNSNKVPEVRSLDNITDLSVDTTINSKVIVSTDSELYPESTTTSIDETNHTSELISFPTEQTAHTSIVMPGENVSERDSETTTTLEPETFSVMNFTSETALYDTFSTTLEVPVTTERPITMSEIVAETITSMENVSAVSHFSNESSYSDNSSLTTIFSIADTNSSPSELITGTEGNISVVSNTSSIWTLQKNTESTTTESAANDTGFTSPVEISTKDSTLQNETDHTSPVLLGNETDIVVHTEPTGVTSESSSTSEDVLFVPTEPYITTAGYNDSDSSLTSEDVMAINSTDIPETNFTQHSNESDNSSEWTFSDFSETEDLFANFTEALGNLSTSGEGETTLSANYSNSENSTAYPETETDSWATDENNTAGISIFDGVGNFSSIEDSDFFNNTLNETAVNATTGIECGEGTLNETATNATSEIECRKNNETAENATTGIKCVDPQVTCKVLNKCLSETLRCDGIDDCPDGSDEKDCEKDECNLNFQCPNDTRCIMSDAHCDGIYDCVDGSDEKNCTPPECGKHEVMCLDGSACIKPGHICDGKYNCWDRSDEIGCVERTTCEEGNSFFCNDGLCIPKSLKCDGAYDCKDKDDEGNCTCSEDEFKCYDGKCLKSSSRCDGHRDCPTAEDEMGCVTVDKQGTVSVYESYSGTWSLLCGDDWTLDAGRYLCQELGYGHVLSVGTHHVSFGGSWMTMKRGNLTAKSFWTEIVASGTCPSNRAAFVKCQTFDCGRYTGFLQRRRREAVNPSAPASQWSFLAYVFFSQSQKGCLSEILTPIWLITSAECLFSIGPTEQPPNGSDWYVRTSVAMDLGSNSTQRNDVQKIVLHPHSSKFRSLTLRDYDVALIRLQHALLLGDTIGAICLPEEQVHPGITCFSGVLGAQKPRAPPPQSFSISSLALMVHDRETCNSVEHYNTQVNNRMLCAKSSTEEAQKICDNDEGTPLICLTAETKWYLAGMLTYQRFCGVYNTHPAVFSNLFAMRQFIDQVTGQKQYEVPYDSNIYVIMPPTTPGPTEAITVTAVHGETTTEQTTENSTVQTSETFMKMYDTTLSKDNITGTVTESMLPVAENETSVYENVTDLTDTEEARNASELYLGTESTALNGTELNATADIFTESPINETSVNNTYYDEESNVTTISDAYFNETEPTPSFNLTHEALSSVHLEDTGLTSPESSEYASSDAPHTTNTTLLNISSFGLPEESDGDSANHSVFESSLAYPTDASVSEIPELSFRNQPLIAVDDSEKETSTSIPDHIYTETSDSGKSFRSEDALHFDGIAPSDSAFNHSLLHENASRADEISHSGNATEQGVTDSEEQVITTSTETYSTLNDSSVNISSDRESPDNVTLSMVTEDLNTDSVAESTAGTPVSQSTTTDSPVVEGIHSELNESYRSLEFPLTSMDEGNMSKKDVAENQPMYLPLAANETDTGGKNDSGEVNVTSYTTVIPELNKEVSESTETVNEGSHTFSSDTENINFNTENKPKMAKMIYDIPTETPTFPSSNLEDESSSTFSPLPTTLEEPSSLGTVIDDEEHVQHVTTETPFAVPSDTSPTSFNPTEPTAVVSDSVGSTVTTSKIDSLLDHDSTTLEGYSVTTTDMTSKMMDLTLGGGVNCGDWDQSLIKEAEISDDLRHNTTMSRWPSLGILRMVSEPGLCAASIISSHSVLTSLSCLRARDTFLNARNWAFTGSNSDQSSGVPSHLYRMVKEIIPCPYANLEPESLAGNDLALVILKDEMHFSQYQMPVCLPQEPLDPEQKCFALGWIKNTSDSEDILQFISMLATIASSDQCNGTDGYNGTLLHSLICVISAQHNSSLGELDTGAPLLCLGRSNRWEVHGIRTASTGSHPPQRPATYSSVHLGKEWVLDTLESLEAAEANL